MCVVDSWFVGLISCQKYPINISPIYTHNPKCKHIQKIYTSNMDVWRTIRIFFLSNNSSFEIQLRIVHLVLMKIKNKHYSGTLMSLIFELGHWNAKVKVPDELYTIDFSIYFDFWLKCDTSYDKAPHAKANTVYAAGAAGTGACAVLVFGVTKMLFVAALLWNCKRNFSFAIVFRHSLLFLHLIFSSCIYITHFNHKCVNAMDRYNMTIFVDRLTTCKG